MKAWNTMDCAAADTVNWTNAMSRYLSVHPKHPAGKVGCLVGCCALVLDGAEWECSRGGSPGRPSVLHTDTAIPPRFHN